MDNAKLAVQEWLSGVVIGYNFCPFAGDALGKGKVRFEVCSETSEELILSDLESELNMLAASPDIETSLLIIDRALNDFGQYNQFLDLAEALVVELGHAGRFQIASFHPDYCFADVSQSDPSNYTNRAPYPVLHILRERSVEWAVENYTDVDLIPEKNIARLHATTDAELKQIIRLSSPSKDSKENT